MRAVELLLGEQEFLVLEIQRRVHLISALWNEPVVLSGRAHFCDRGHLIISTQSRV